MISFQAFRQTDGTPIYLQIIRYIQQGLAAGTIRDGDELPSRRVLSALLAVNPNTVQKAFRLLEDERLAPGCISATYIKAVAVAERGAWPVALLDLYGFDAAHVAEYARMAKTEAGFREYLDRFVFQQRVAAE